jgi:hypothetical protein
MISTDAVQLQYLTTHLEADIHIKLQFLPHRKHAADITKTKQLTTN